MPEIAALARNRAEIDVDFGDGVTVHVVYDPSKMSAEAEGKAADLQRNNQRWAAVASYLASVVIEWDLTDKKKPYPPTFENIVKLPFEANLLIRDSILLDYYPNVRTVGSSANGSRRTASSDDALSE